MTGWFKWSGDSLMLIAAIITAIAGVFAVIVPVILHILSEKKTKNSNSKNELGDGPHEAGRKPITKIKSPREIVQVAHINASFAWVEFVLTNSDIMVALSKTPILFRKINNDTFRCKAIGFVADIKRVECRHEGHKGFIVKSIDICMPLRLGRTHTTADYTYYAIDDKTTSLKVKFKLKVTGLFYRYTKIRSSTLIDNMCPNIEMAARMLENEDDEINSRLSENQRNIVKEYRKKARDLTNRMLHPETAEAYVSISSVSDKVRVRAEVTMPDKQILRKENTIKEEGEKKSVLFEKAKQLGCIGDSVLVNRGKTPSNESKSEFRRAAKEFGHSLYQHYLTRDLDGVMSPLVYGINPQNISFYIDVDKSVEVLPWEALYYEGNFLSLKFCFARTLGVPSKHLLHNNNKITDFKILLVGSDSRSDLPGIPKEIQSIQKHLVGAGVSKITPVMDREANRSNILELIESREYNILHFSGHSVFNPESPIDSYLELAQGGKLFLHDLRDFIELSSGSKFLNLVFLNSCQSGRTGFDSATGTNLSMCRALREIGVDNVIGMLWDVSDDAATYLASIFYKTLATKETDVIEALRITRNQVGLDSEWRDNSWLAPILYV